MDDIKSIFDDHQYHHFGIRNYEYSLDETDPTVKIEVGHYRQPEIIEIQFSDVYFQSTMSESFIFMNEDDNWETNVFIAKAKTSKLIDWVASYTLLGAEHIIELEKLSHYRIYGQDHFIEIVSTQKPKMKLVNET